MNRSLAVKLIVAVLAVLLTGLGMVLLRDVLTLDYLAAQEATLRNYQQLQPFFTYVCAFLLYVIVAGLSIPGATVLTLLFAWFFGLLPAILLVSFASTTGATLAFLLSRYLFRDAIQSKFGSRLVQFDEALKREGPFYLFTLRLIPLVPFFVINAVMGLTPLKTITYYWVSQLGMLPATIVYAYAGASVPTLAELESRGLSGLLNWQTSCAFAALGLFPLVMRFLFRNRSQPSGSR